MNPKEHIENIAQKMSDGSDEIKENLKNAISKLSKELYNKDIHFIFELIQNAEDNFYDKSIEPSLTFHLLSSDPTNTPGSNGALLIVNNEIGFSPENINAICSVGKSTKKKSDGYIGEKGIGFKSVFRISSIPHIFSNGYAFNLPEDDELSGVGYIVPRWVDTIPNELDISSTIIILPLNKEEYGFEKIERDLHDIELESIMFLSKLKRIKVTVDEQYDLIISRDDLQYPLVKICKETHSMSSNFKSENLDEKYFVHTESFLRPDGLKIGGREDIHERQVTVALPLSSDSKSAGQIFAYLPVSSNSGLPFLLNADFLLTSGRESIMMDDKWNEWLRDCVADTFVKAFELAIDNEHYQMQVYGFIPLSANDEFFEPIVESIYEKLKNSEVILTQPDLKKCLPVGTMTAPKKFRSLMTDTYPQHLLSQRLVCSELEKFKDQLDVIGVRKLMSQDIITCLMDKKWIENQGLKWLVNCYKYLSESKLDELDNCPIVPVRYRGSDSIRFSCNYEQPIYFECDYETKDILSEVHSCVNVPLVFLDSNFFQLIKNDDDLQSWMTEKLQIYSFSRENYAVDVTCWLNKHFHKLTKEELVSVTYFLAQFDNIDDIPVLLDTGDCDLLSQVKELENVQMIVTPMALDSNTGWQNIFQTEDDRSHLAILSDEYLRNDGAKIESLMKLWRKLGITAYPLPKSLNKKCYTKFYDSPFINNSLTEYEQKLAVKIRPNSAVSRVTDMTVQNYITPDTILKQTSINRKTLSRSIIRWLEMQIGGLNELNKYGILDEFNYSWRLNLKLNELGLMLKISYENRGTYSNYFDSSFLNSLKNIPWLFTTKGFVMPSEAFLPEKNIKAIFGDTVPYVENISEDVVKLLGIRKETTVEELLDVLANHAKNHTGSKDLAYRIYKYLDFLEAIGENIISRFEEENLIYVPSYEHKWLSSKNVIWFDRSDVLGDDFAYLEKIYPELNNFFVKVLGVNTDVDTEHFAERWLTLQKKDTSSHDEIKDILFSIYKELLPICKKENNEHPDWWSHFVQDAKIWTQDNTFDNPNGVYVSDDGDLEQIFRDVSINLAWCPEKYSFSHWEPLYRALDVSYLSESLKISLAADVKYSIVDESKYLTNASKILIVTWLAEKAPNDYKKLRKSNLLESLLNTNEASAESISVIYELDSEVIKKEHDAYWIQDNEILVVSQISNQDRLKNMIARTLARTLISNRDYKDFATWIELILCTKDWECRVKQNSWHIPEEANIWLNINTQSSDLNNANTQNVSEGNSNDINLSDEKEASGDEVIGQDMDSKTVDTPSLTESHVPDVSSQPSQTSSDNGQISNVNLEENKPNVPVKKSDFNINRQGSTKVNETGFNSQSAIKPNVRGPRITAMHNDDIINEPNPADRRIEPKSTVLEPSDKQVAVYLKQLYEGECQICGQTFSKRNGNPFFIVNYIIPRKHARFCDTPSNALCLCADHFAKWQHGTLKANIFNQAKDLKIDGNIEDQIIEIELCGEKCQIHYKPKHIFDLQTFIELL